MRYAPNRCVAFAAFPVFLTVWIREGMGLTANNVYKLHFEFSEKTLYGVVSGESHLSSHPPPQVRKRLGVSGVRDAFFSSELK